MDLSGFLNVHSSDCHSCYRRPRARPAAEGPPVDVAGSQRADGVFAPALGAICEPPFLAAGRNTDRRPSGVGIAFFTGSTQLETKLARVSRGSGRHSAGGLESLLQADSALYLVDAV